MADEAPAQQLQTAAPPPVAPVALGVTGPAAPGTGILATISTSFSSPTACAQPAKAALKVEVRPSSIPQAGQGLFASAPIQRDELIAEYSGRILSLAQAKVLRNRMYLKAVTLNRHIDAAGPEGSVAKYINDHTDPARHNVKFCKVGNQILVRAKRDIAPGEELFIDYGRGHWLFCGSAAFLGLRVTSAGAAADPRFPPSQPLLRTARRLAAHEVVCCLSSPAMADVDGLSAAIVFAPSVGADLDKAANCRLKPSPFVRNTIMVTSLRPIEAGETIIVRAQDRLSVDVSTVPGAHGMGAFAREPLQPGQVLGALSGAPIRGRDALLRALSLKPAAAATLVIPVVPSSRETSGAPSADVFIDPSDAQGRIWPFKDPHVNFIVRHHDDAAVNCAILAPSSSADSHAAFLVVVTKPIAAGEEAFLSAHADFSADALARLATPSTSPALTAWPTATQGRKPDKGAHPTPL